MSLSIPLWSEFMSVNLETHKKDLDRLLQFGEKLLYSLHKEYDPSSYKPLKSEDIKELPNFLENYQTWYVEALTTIQQVLPNRESDFIKLYKNSTNRKNIDLINYGIEDYLMGFQKGSLFGAAFPRFHQQLAILKSAKKIFESSLFDIKQLLQADLFDSELEAAKELNKKGFVHGSGAIAGVVLEGHLKEVCNNHKIKVKNPTINDLNQLLKSNETIDTAQWRNIQRLGDLRNLCTHKKQADPTKEKVTELIEGVEKIIKTLF